MTEKIINFIMIKVLLLFTVGSIIGILSLSGKLYFKKASFVSQNGEYKIVIKGNGPKWSFGSEDIKIYAYNNNSKGYFDKKIYKTEISNDGKL